MQKISQTQFQLTKQLLDDGTILAVPTETIYGLAAKFNHTGAIEKLLSIKDRKIKDDDKVFALMLADVAEIENFVCLSPFAKTLAHQYFPGELTAVLPKSPKLKNYYFDHFDTIGIRIPNHPYMLELLRFTGPLLVTSANRRGLSPCCTSEDIEQRLPEIDAVVTGKAKGNLPSTVISIIDSEIKILRQGALKF